MRNFQAKSIILGMGIGIVFTALVSIIYNAGGYSSMSKEEIISAAKSYGMIEPENLFDSGGKKESTSGSQKKNGTKEDSVQNNGGAKSINTTESTEEAQTGTDVASGQAVQNKPEQQEEYVSIDIQEGDNSYTVGEKLANSGLVSSAGEFNIAIINAGLDSKIMAGNYQIRKGSSIQEIISTIVPNVNR